MCCLLLADLRLEAAEPRSYFSIQRQILGRIDNDDQDPLHVLDCYLHQSLRHGPGALARNRSMARMHRVTVLDPRRNSPEDPIQY